MHGIATALLTGMEARMTDTNIKILKVGNRMGSLSKHAVVQAGGKLKLMVQYGTQWVELLQGPICTEVRRHFTGQLF